MHEDDRTIRTDVPGENAGPADASQQDTVFIDASDQTGADAALVDEDTGPLEAVRVVDPPAELQHRSSRGSVLPQPGRPLTLVVVGTLLLGLLAWAALRDVAGRLDGSAAEATPAPEFDPSFASSFAPGPRLGDLSDVLGRAREARAQVEVRDDDGEGTTTPSSSGSEGGRAATTTSTEPSGSSDGTATKDVSGSDGSFGSSQSHNWNSSGDGGGSQSPPRQPSDGGGSGGGGGGSDLCDMPAFC